MRYTPVRFHLIEGFLSDPKGEWTIRELTERVAERVQVPVGGVQDSVYVLMSRNFLEAVPGQRSLTVRLKTDEVNKLDDTAKTVQQLTRLLTDWRDQHGQVGDYLPDLAEGGDRR